MSEHDLDYNVLENKFKDDAEMIFLLSMHKKLALEIDKMEKHPHTNALELQKKKKEKLEIKTNIFKYFDEK